MSNIPTGKLPPDLLARMLEQAHNSDSRLILGPGIGLDCAVVALDETCLVFKSDPITFATAEIGWYAVQVNANDIATTGATPRWFLVTALLPEGKTTTESVELMSRQVSDACRTLGISVIGGHTEITHGLDRPILIGTMVGEVSREALITPRGTSPGDRLLLTKGVPIEGTAILAREFPHRLKNVCTADEIHAASDFLYDPGISVVRDARFAIQTGKVTAMHDPTEGGLTNALWELAEACGYTLVFNPEAVFIPPLSKKICEAFGIDPLRTIASGALLLAAPPEDAGVISQALNAEGILCTEIGFVESGSSQVLQSTRQGRVILPYPDRDEIARILNANP
jgi:hydrogenase maturation factor